jgi:hypothetical protein
MEGEPQLAPGDEVQCPHCQRWHEVQQLYAADTTAAYTHLYVTCAKTNGKYFVGTVGSAPRWPWRRSRSFF